MRRRSVIVLAAALAACADADTAIGPSAPAFAVSDARTEGGNPHFFWLPPIGSAEGAGGPVAADIQPEVRICRLEGDACGDEVGHFTLDAADDADRLRVDGGGSHYLGTWHTGRAHDGAGLDEAATYRIRVLVGGQELGFADVRAARGMAKKTIDGAAYVVVQPGQTLPIRFRVEDGAVAPEPEEPGTSVVLRAMAAAAYHTCAIADGGAAWCWGSGWSGQLGNGVYDEVASPAQVLGGHAFAAIAVSATHSCGLDTAGAAFCWGSNASGALGTGAAGGTEHTPVAVAGGFSFVQIDAGSGFTCARTAGGALFCWGAGLSGQLGDGAAADSPTPVAVAGGHTFATFDTGAEHVCGITVQGAALCWGGNLWGQLGNGATAPAYPYIGSATPHPVTGGHIFGAISAGTNHTCALTGSGEAWCWGAGYDGQAGDGSTTGSLPDPVPVAGGLLFRSIDAGGNHTCAVATDDSGWCWGSTGFGQTGTGTPGAPAQVTQPAPVLGSLAWSEIRGGEIHTCGTTTSGAALCWGGAGLGTGSPDPAAAPVPVAGGLVIQTN